MQKATAAPIIPVILAGGSGERLWPLSKDDYPKQFVTFGPYASSLFQQSLTRVSDRTAFAAPIIVCNQLHRFIVEEQLHALAVSDATLIIEPLVRNTAPALALAALHAPEDALLLVMPSDHLIGDSDAFFTAVADAAVATLDDWLVTFAITPTEPQTGYGYIKLGELVGSTRTHRLERFIEKPTRELAETFLAEGNYGWNSGIFVMKSAAARQAFAAHEPTILAQCAEAYRHHRTDGSAILPDPQALASCPATSIDYAIMEHTVHGAVIPVEMGWSDLGSWPAVSAISHKTSEGNTVEGRALLTDTTGCYIRSDHMLVAAIGLEDMVVVAADNAVLVGPKSRMQEIKRLIGQMREQLLPDLNLTRFSHRPWGSFHRIDQGPHYQVKKLQLKPGGKISLQSHAHRSEHWVVVAGRATITRDDQVTQLEQNASTYIPAGTIHRLENREHPSW